MLQTVQHLIPVLFQYCLIILISILTIKANNCVPSITHLIQHSVFKKLYFKFATYTAHRGELKHCFSLTLFLGRIKKDKGHCREIYESQTYVHSAVVQDRNPIK